MKNLYFSIRSLNFTVPFVLFLGILILYVHHLSPSIYQYDSGDFATAIIAKGIPHSSGYPLYVLLGIGANSLPIQQTVAWKIGLISAFASAFSVLLTYLTIQQLTKNRLVGVITSLYLAFFSIFWLYAEVIEVFALNTFFVILLLYLGVQLYNSGKRKFLFLLAFIAGLSLTNNESIILVFPALIPLLIKHFRMISWKNIGASVLFFLIGLLPYLYLPISASFNALPNSTYQNTLQGFFDFILRKEYGWGISSPKLYALDQLKYYFHILTSELKGVIIPVLMGIFYLIYKRRFVILTTLFLGFLFTGPLFFIYSRALLSEYVFIGVFNRFCIVPSVFLVFFAAFGIHSIVIMGNNLIKGLLSKLNNSPINRNYTLLLTSIFLFLPYFGFLKNGIASDLHNVWVGNNLGIDILGASPKNSLLLLYSDTAEFNTQYVQQSQNLRSDIIVPTYINAYGKKLMQTELLAQASKKFKKKYPHIDNETLFLLALNSIRNDHSILYLYPTQPDKTKYNEEIKYIPYGLLSKIASDQDLRMSQEDYEKQQNTLLRRLHIEELKSKGKSTAATDINFLDVRGMYANAFFTTARYLAKHYHDSSKAQYYINKTSDLILR